MRQLPNPIDLGDAVRLVIENNLSDGYPPRRFAAVTESGTAHNLLAICAKLISKGETLERVEEALASTPMLLTGGFRIPSRPRMGLRRSNNQNRTCPVGVFRPSSWPHAIPMTGTAESQTRTKPHKVRHPNEPCRAFENVMRRWLAPQAKLEISLVERHSEIEFVTF